MRFPVIAKIVLTTALIAVVIAIAAGVDLGTFDAGPAQPIPFSHRIHATTKQINCFFCHPGASHSSNAGIPPVDKCLLCHKVIASNFASIRKILDYDAQNKPIPWVRVVQVPNHVHFSHQAHIAGGHDCGECHGDVKAMDRVKLVRTINMDFCTSCHKENKISVNCVICHY